MASKKPAAKAPSNSANGSNAILPWLGLATIVLLLDQLSKITISHWLPLGGSHPLTSFFNLVFIYNPGAAWSFLAHESGWQRYFFIGIGLIAAVFIIIQLRLHAGQRLYCWALSLILGGAIGNVLDRFFYGKVIDFFDFYYNHWHFPAFNVADSAICLGAGLFILDELRRVNKN
jgi:signal peptidase II